MKVHHLFIMISALILLQGCTYYKNVSTTLTDATDKGRVKVITKQNDELVFKKIYIRDSIYYGVRALDHIQLHPYQISEVYLKDIKKSRKVNWTTTLIIVGIPIVYILVIIILISTGVVGIV